MTEFEQRLDILVEMLADPNITINPSGMAKIKENLLSSAKEGLWHDAQGDNLPPIEKEVIVLLDNGKVCFAHRPCPQGWWERSIIHGEREHFIPQTYGKGGWNIPDVRWWLNAEIPKCKEEVE